MTDFGIRSVELSCHARCQLSFTVTYWI